MRNNINGRFEQKHYFNPGDRIGWLIFIKEGARANGIRTGVFKCDCGNVSEIRYASMSKNPKCNNRKAHSNSKKHGMSYTPEHNTWINFVGRCTNPRNKSYKYYGGRGITVCDRWLRKFENFYEDMGQRPAGHTLERIDNNGNYEKDNCRWATMAEQNRNKRWNNVIEYKGEKMCMTDMAAKYGITYKVLHDRLEKLGWPLELAITTPTMTRQQASSFKKY